MNKKGFNLFTALVAFVLIMLTALLVQSMIQSERNTADTITDTQRLAELQAVADMARADAFQVFNYKLRKKIEDWLGRPQNVYTLNLENWKEIQNNYALTMFGGSGGGEQFASYVANAFESFFYSEQSFGVYSISLEGDLETLEQELAAIVDESVDDGFFQVVGCDDGDPKNCQNGTFYINLKVADIDAGKYERLPRIKVTDKATGDTIQQAVLPRRNFKIFVPLRLFKAIAEARALAHNIPTGVSATNENNFNTNVDYGLLSPRIHNEIEEMALGMCDYGYCNYRSDPYVPPTEKSISGSACPTSASVASPLPHTVVCTQNLFDKGMCDTLASETNITFTPSIKDDLTDALEGLVEKRVCAIARDLDWRGDDEELELQGVECNGMVKVIEVGTSAPQSKNVWVEGTSSSGVLGYTSQNYSANKGFGAGQDCPMSNDFGLVKTRNVGLFNDGSGVSSLQTIVSSSCTGLSGDASLQKGHCAEVSSLKVTLGFKETNPIYMVDESRGGIEFKIKISDTRYKSFLPTYNQSRVNNSTCALEGEPTYESCDFNPGGGWYCKTSIISGDVPGGGFGLGGEDDYCRPA